MCVSLQSLYFLYLTKKYLYIVCNLYRIQSARSGMHGASQWNIIINEPAAMGILSQKLMFTTEMLTDQKWNQN